MDYGHSMVGSYHTHHTEKTVVTLVSNKFISGADDVNDLGPGSMTLVFR